MSQPRPPTVPTWLSIGWVLALLVLLLAVIFAAINQMDLKVAVLLAMLALARLIP